MKPTPEEIDLVLGRASEIARQYVKEHADPGQPVVHWHEPAELAERFDLDAPEQGRSWEEILDLSERVLHYSVRTGHPGFANQLFGGWDLAGVLGEWMTVLLNTSMYTYEVAPVLTLMETAAIRALGRLAGFDECEGVFAPGGSVANLMAMLAARGRAYPQVRRCGLEAGHGLEVFVSEEAHYSCERAAMIAGLGLKAVRKVPTDAEGKMRADELHDMVEESREEGRRPFMVVATAGSTVAGVYDPLEEIAKIAQRNAMWMHVDASFGGSVLFSGKHRHLMHGCPRADSMTWNPHKMLGVPLQCSALLVKEKGRLLATNALGADYLFHDPETECCDLGDLSIQCGRRVDILKFWLSWQAHGSEGYAQMVERKFELARLFARMLQERPHFQLLRAPESVNVCFHFLPPSVRGLPPGPERNQRLSELTVTLRERVKRAGKLLINYAKIDGVQTFRLVLSNAKVEESDLARMLDALEEEGGDL